MAAWLRLSPGLTKLRYQCGTGFDSVVAANHKLAGDRGNALLALSEAEYQRWVKASSDVDDQWLKEVGAKGANGQALLEEARALIQQHDR